MLQFSKIAGRYAVIEPLYSRGAIRAYLARDEHAGGVEVVVELEQSAASAGASAPNGERGGASERMRYEGLIATLGALGHPNLAVPERFVVDEPYFGVVKAHEQGRLLVDWLGSQTEHGPSGPQPSSRKVERSLRSALCRDILEGLAALHEVGILHRNLVLRSIWLSEGGRRPVARIDDFSAAVSAWEAPVSSSISSSRPSKSQPASSQLASSQLASSQPSPSVSILPSRLAPEVARSGVYSTQSDVYAAGLILLELLAEPADGARGLGFRPSSQSRSSEPGSGFEPSAILDQGRPTAEQVRAWVLPPFTEVVVRATQALRVERFEDGLDLLAAFDAVDLRNRLRGLPLD